MATTGLLPRACRVEAEVPAPVEAVWRVVADVTRTGEWSHECHVVEWLGGATAAAPGVRFRGANRSAWWRWHRTSVMTDVLPGRSIAWRTIPTWRYVDSTEWRITLEPLDDGTRITQTYEVLRCPRWWEWLIARVNPPHRDRTTALAADLVRLGAVAAGSAPDPGPRALTRWGNRFGVWLYRRSHGGLAGPGRGTTVALLTVPGRRTGLPRTVALGLHEYGPGYLAVGTGGGSPREPDWFRNLRAAQHADVQIRNRHVAVEARVADGEERDRLWRDVVLVQAPWRAAYEQKSGRRIPVAVLTAGEPPVAEAVRRSGASRPETSVRRPARGQGASPPVAATVPTRRGT